MTRKPIKIVHVFETRKCPDCDGWGSFDLAPADPRKSVYATEQCHTCDGEGTIPVEVE